MYESVARSAGLSLKRFGVPIDQVGFRPADHIVNVPIDTMMKDAGMGRIKTYRQTGTFDHWYDRPAFDPTDVTNTNFYWRR